MIRCSLVGIQVFILKYPFILLTASYIYINFQNKLLFAKINKSFYLYELIGNSWRVNHKIEHHAACNLPFLRHLSNPIKWLINSRKLVNRTSKLTENAFKNTKHCIIPSIVSPVRQNVPVRWRPLRPTAVASEACTRARRPCPLFDRLGGNGAARINRSIESII